MCRLDRLGGSLPHLLSLVEDLAARGVGLHSLAEQIDTSSATGRLVLHVLGALAEFSVIWTRRDMELRELEAAA